MGTDIILRLEGLTVRYGAFVAVDWGTEALTHRFLPWFRRARA